MGMRLAVCLVAASSCIHAANIMAFSCGAVVGNVVNNNNGTWGLSVTCASGMTFNGTSTLVDTGAPSDMRIQGVFLDVPGGALTESLPFSLSGFTQPAGPVVEAWHELHGTMNLGGGGGQASLTASAGVLNGCGTGGVTTGMINGAFNVAEVPHVICNGNPLWTRGVTLTANFNANVAANGSITLGEGQNDNFFQAVPEPATYALVVLGLVALAARGRKS